MKRLFLLAALGCCVAPAYAQSGKGHPGTVACGTALSQLLIDLGDGPDLVEVKQSIAKCANEGYRDFCKQTLEYIGRDKYKSLVEGVTCKGPPGWPPKK